MFPSFGILKVQRISIRWHSINKPVAIAVMPPQMINGPGGGMMRHPMDQPSYPGAPFPGPHQPRPDQYSNYPMGRGQGNYVMMSQHGGPVNGKNERTNRSREICRWWCQWTRIRTDREWAEDRCSRRLGLEDRFAIEIVEMPFNTSWEVP